ncbi:MAG TPA: hypothetical protein DCS93_38210 [Microscillaceae bacterium]|nr:hypothetical protein [Microscillaceae bacterium]
MSKEYEFINELTQTQLLHYTMKKLYKGANNDAKLQECEDIVVEAWESFLTNDKYTQLWENRTVANNAQQIVNILKKIIFFKITDRVKGKKDFLKQHNSDYNRTDTEILDDMPTSQQPEDKAVTLANAFEYLKANKLKQKDITFMMFYIEGTLDGYDTEALVKNWNQVQGKSISKDSYEKHLRRVRKKLKKENEDQKFYFIIFGVHHKGQATDLTQNPHANTSETITLSPQSQERIKALANHIRPLAPTHLLVKRHRALDNVLFALGALLVVMMNVTDSSSRPVHPSKPFLGGVNNSPISVEVQQTNKDTVLGVSFEQDAKDEEEIEEEEERLNIANDEEEYDSTYVEEDLLAGLEEEENPSTEPYDDDLDVSNKPKSVLRQAETFKVENLRSVGIQIANEIHNKEITPEVKEAEADYYEARNKLAKLYRKIGKKLSKKMDLRPRIDRKTGNRQKNRNKQEKIRGTRQWRKARKRKKRGQKIGRKQFSTRQQIAVIHRRITKIQQKITRQTLLIYGEKENGEFVKLDVKNTARFSSQKLTRLLVSFNIPGRQHKKIFFCIKVGDQDFINVPLQTDSQGRVRQYIVLKNVFNQLKKTNFTINIAKKQKANTYRSDIFASYKFSLKNDQQ